MFKQSDIPYFEEVVTASGGTIETPVDIKFTRMGSQVTLQFLGETKTTSNVTAVALQIVPERFRPSVEVFNVYSFGDTAFNYACRIRVRPDGILGLEAFDRIYYILSVNNFLTASITYNI